MLGKRHKKFGGGLGGTTGDSVMTWYATPEMMHAEQAAFRRAVYRQQLADQTLAIRVLGARKAKRNRPVVR